MSLLQASSSATSTTTLMSVGSVITPGAVSSGNSGGSNGMGSAANAAAASVTGSSTSGIVSGGVTPQSVGTPAEMRPPPTITKDPPPPSNSTTPANRRQKPWDAMDQIPLSQVGNGLSCKCLIDIYIHIFCLFVC